MDNFISIIIRAGTNFVKYHFLATYCMSKVFVCLVLSHKPTSNITIIGQLASILINVKGKHRMQD